MHNSWARVGTQTSREKRNTREGSVTIESYTQSNSHTPIDEQPLTQTKSKQALDQNTHKQTHWRTNTQTIEIIHESIRWRI